MHTPNQFHETLSCADFFIVSEFCQIKCNVKFSVLLPESEKYFCYTMVVQLTGVYPLGSLYTGCQNLGNFPMSIGLPFHSLELVPEVIGCQKITGQTKAFSAFIKLVGGRNEVE